MVLSRSYNPYYNTRAVRSGPTTYALRQPEPEVTPQFSRHHLADRRRQALLEVNDTPPQQNEVFYPQAPEGSAVVPVETTDIYEPVEKTEVAPTPKDVAVPEISEPEIEKVPEEPVQKPKKAVNKTKQIQKPVDDDDDEDEDESYAKIPTGAYFPMFFGWSGKSGSGGPIAIGNSYSTGRGGVSASDATAYGTPVIEKRV